MIKSFKILFLLFILSQSCLFSGQLIKATIINLYEVPIYNFCIYNNYIYAACKTFEIIKFDMSGKKLFSAIRKGEGPGEFKNISGFRIYKNILYCSDYISKKIVLLDTDRFLPIKELRKKESVLLAMPSNFGDLYLVENFVTGKIRLKLIDNDNCIFEASDESKINIPLPDGRRPSFPWFPAPFPNKLRCILSQDLSPVIFFTRKNYFTIIENSNKRQINFSIEGEIVKEKDKKYFFSRITDVNRSNKAIVNVFKYIDFPKTKELFLDVFPWENGFALIKDNFFQIISYKGAIIDNIKIPGDIKLKENDVRKLGDSFFFIDNKLYYLNESNLLMVFNYIP